MLYDRHPELQSKWNKYSNAAKMRDWHNIIACTIIDNKMIGLREDGNMIQSEWIVQEYSEGILKKIVRTDFRAQPARILIKLF